MYYTSNTLLKSLANGTSLSHLRIADLRHFLVKRLEGCCMLCSELPLAF